MTNVEKVLDLYRGIAERDPALAVRHLQPDRYVEHDPHVEGGVAGVRRYVEALGPDDRLDVVRVLDDGNQVVVQADGKVRDDGTFFDLFRFEDGLIVEHWGFAAPAGPPNKSGHTQVDGPAEPAHLDCTAANKAFARDYYENFHLAGQYDLADHYFAGSPMVRHEPGVEDGTDNFLRDLATLTKDRTIDELRLFAGQGDLVFLAALGTHAGAPCAYVDLYRVADERVMEHWGFFQPVPPAGGRRDVNPMI